MVFVYRLQRCESHSTDCSSLACHQTFCKVNHCSVGKFLENQVISHSGSKAFWFYERSTSTRPERVEQRICVVLYILGIWFQHLQDVFSTGDDLTEKRRRQNSSRKKQRDFVTTVQIMAVYICMTEKAWKKQSMRWQIQEGGWILAWKCFRIG